MSDLIDRQAALALAKDICVPTKDGTVYRHRCIDPQQIMELPSAEPERKWIPVTEALPKEKGEYLVSYHPCHWTTVSDKVVVGTDTFRGKTNWAKMKYQKVIAWMPFPEAWRGD